MIKIINMEDIPNKSGKYISVNADIEGFLASGASAAEVTVPQKRKPQNVCSAYKTAAARNNYAVNVIQRDGRVFLTRKEQ